MASEIDGLIAKGFGDSVALRNQLAQDRAFLDLVGHIVDAVAVAFESGHRVWFCGNGGSAADAQHLAAEFSGRYYYDRPALPSEALHVNTSYVTAVANDYSYDQIYSRLIGGCGSSGDVLIGLTTSGNSKNVVAAFETARAKGLTTIGFTGALPNSLAEHSDFILAVPSKDTPRIQELHMLVGHIVCEAVERRLFPR